MNHRHEDNFQQIFGNFAAYHGLQNQGATCYLNSVLQVLFMTKDFREAVERYCSEDRATIDHQLKGLFHLLKRFETNTNAITRKLGIEKVCEQRDAAEYFEKILSMTGPKVSQIFHGQLTHSITCSGCQKRNDADSPFWTLPLAMKDSYQDDEVYSVMDGIEAFFRSSKVSGDNQMYCVQCDGKADATIECQLQRHPEVLTLLLKRFEFDYEYMDYVKINRPVVVPLSLLPQTNLAYELYAVVDHYGNLKSGHYTARIKSQDDGRWYLFDDSCVTLLYSQPFQLFDPERQMFWSASAYLLFYRKNKMHPPDTLIHKVNQDSSFEDHQVATSQPVEKQHDDYDLTGRKTKDGEATEEGDDTVEAVSTERHSGGSQMMEDSNQEPSQASASSQSDSVEANLKGVGAEMKDVDQNLSKEPEGNDDGDEEAVVDSDKWQKEVDSGDDGQRAEEEQYGNEMNQASLVERRELHYDSTSQYEGRHDYDLKERPRKNYDGAAEEGDDTVAAVSTETHDGGKEKEMENKGGVVVTDRTGDIVKGHRGGIGVTDRTGETSVQGHRGNLTIYDLYMDSVKGVNYQSSIQKYPSKIRSMMTDKVSEMTKEDYHADTGIFSIVGEGGKDRGEESKIGDCDVKCSRIISKMDELKVKDVAEGEHNVTDIIGETEKDKAQALIRATDTHSTGGDVEVDKNTMEDRTDGRTAKRGVDGEHSSEIDVASPVLSTADVYGVSETHASDIKRRRMQRGEEGKRRRYSPYDGGHRLTKFK